MTKDEMLKERDRLAKEHATWTRYPLRLDGSVNETTHRNETMELSFRFGFDAALKLMERERVKPLRDALKDASDTIHGEFCGSGQHHPLCKPLLETLSQVEEWHE